MTRALPVPLTAAEPMPIPSIYLACPLTNLNLTRRRVLTSEVSQVRMAIEQLTVGDRVETETWPVAIYAPIDNTAPWSDDQLTPASVYERNYTKVLDADAFIILADDGGSSGGGQETEWAARLGIPILYLSSAGTVSRQIAGIPATINCVAYNNDSGTLTAHVANFLRLHRARILDGPRRRASRRLRFEPLAVQLREQWRRTSDPTGVAARCLLTPAFVDLSLADGSRLAALSADALIMLCAELGVPLSPAARQLSVPATRALILAAIEDMWSDDLVERLRLYGLAATTLNPDEDLATLDAWRRLRAELTA